MFPIRVRIFSVIRAQIQSHALIVHVRVNITTGIAKSVGTV